MKNFLIFLFTFIKNHYSRLALLFLIITGFYGFNTAKNYYCSLKDLSDFSYYKYFNDINILVLILSLCLIFVVFYHVKKANSKGLSLVILFYCLLSIPLLFFMLVCLNEMNINCLTYSLHTPLDFIGWIHSVNNTNNSYANFYYLDKVVNMTK